MNFFIEAILFILPAYVANSAAVVFGGGTPIDFGRKLFNQPIFGKGKTWKGIVLGTLFGTAIGFCISFLFPSFIDGKFFVLSFLLSFGALMGDLFFSFVKRRLRMKRGHPFPVVDQLDFVLGALLFSSIVYLPSLATIIFLIIVTPILHLGANYIGYQLKLKKEPY